MVTSVAVQKRLNGDTVKTRPQRRLTQSELDAFLEKAADLLRGGIDHSEFREYVFALRMHDFIVPDDCLWQKVARTTERELGKALKARFHPISFSS
jgi:type I restriction enzyme M protein